MGKEGRDEPRERRAERPGLCPGRTVIRGEAGAALGPKDRVEGALEGERREAGREAQMRIQVAEDQA